MELFYNAVAVICAIFLSVNTWKFLNWVWFKPRAVERRLREQGFNGNSYRFFIGDMKEMATMAKEAHAKTIKFSNDTVPKVMPFIHESIKKYGENCFIWFGANPAVLISSPEMIKEILSKSYVFQKNNAGPIHKLFAQGLAASETDKWAKHRKLINPAFHLEKLKHVVPSFYLSCAEMLSKWEEMVPSEGFCELDVSPYLQTMTSDVISRTAFGSNFEEGRKIFELLKEQGGLILKALQMLYIPGWRFLPTKTKRRMKQIVKEVDSSILGIIKKRMQVIEAGEANSRDLLGILLESNSNEIKQNGNEFGMSLQEVIEECKLFYIAGQETTSNLLVWTMILLGKHLDWQARAREEVLQVLGSNRQPDFEELNRLKIITMIFYEVLRLYPPLPLMNRYIQKETTIGNLTLPPGIQLFLPKILLHHDTKIWGDDAKEFKPGRFSEGIAKATKGQFSYFPFSAGPRVCIGQNFAMLEAKMAIAMILQCYSFEISPSYAHAPEVVLTLEPQYGAQLIFRRV